MTAKRVESNQSDSCRFSKNSFSFSYRLSLKRSTDCMSYGVQLLLTFTYSCSNYITHRTVVKVGLRTVPYIDEYTVPSAGQVLCPNRLIR